MKKKFINLISLQTKIKGLIYNSTKITVNNILFNIIFKQFH